MALSLIVNGEQRSSLAAATMPLVDVLREEFHLTGAKPVCREGFCGACLVLLDGKPTPSCLVPAALAENHDIRTVEGLSVNGALTPIQAALEACDVVQCGMCFPGMVVSLTYLLTTAPQPTSDEVRAALTGNICRCTGYERIIEAVLRVSAVKEV